MCAETFFCREDLIAELQSEERERQWHYTQLELISQKLRSLPLTSSLSVSTRACTNTSVPDMLQIIWCTMGEMQNCTRERWLWFEAQDFKWQSMKTLFGDSFSFHTFCNTSVTVLEFGVNCRKGNVVGNLAWWSLVKSRNLTRCGTGTLLRPKVHGTSALEGSCRQIFTLHSVTVSWWPCLLHCVINENVWKNG